MMRARLVLGAVLAGALAACSTGPVLTQPASDIPDLRGTWRGTWAATPVTLVVMEQGGTARQGGIALGPWPITGAGLPSMAGVLTFVSHGTPITVNVQGRFGDFEGGFTLVVDALTADRQQLVFTHVGDDRLGGFGTSRLDWDPRGPIDLSRAASPSR
jgi:hypothetical protein